jgi:hypothetical protein
MAFNQNEQLPISCFSSISVGTVGMVVVFLKSFVEVTRTGTCVIPVEAWAVNYVTIRHVRSGKSGTYWTLPIAIGTMTLALSRLCHPPLKNNDH